MLDSCSLYSVGQLCRLCLGFPGGSAGKETACSVGDSGSNWLGRRLHSSILAMDFSVHGLYSPWDLKVRHDWAAVFSSSIVIMVLDHLFLWYTSNFCFLCFKTLSLGLYTFIIVYFWWIEHFIIRECLSISPELLFALSL